MLLKGLKYTNIDLLWSRDRHVLVTNLVTTSVVLCFCRNPYWFSYNICIHSRKNRLLCAIFSSNMEIDGNKDIGL